jgi:mannose-6-phosphate isomerase-like protein (cupin superfamily)
MNMQKLKYISSFLMGAIALFVLQAFAKDLPIEKYILVHEKDIAKEQPGPHKGGGSTISYPFFEGTTDFKMAFRKRVLRPGSAIGYHLQETDEIYYILQGNGKMQMNGKTFPVTAGDAVLTRPGSSHGLMPSGNEDLTLMIAYTLE